MKPHPSLELPRSCTRLRRPPVVALTVKILSKPPEDCLEVINVSILEGYNSNGRSGPLDAISTDGVHLNDNGDRVGGSRRVHTLRRTNGNIHSTTPGYNAARSSSDLGDLALFSSKEIHTTQSLPQATGSGTVFSRIQQASGARISTEQFELERSSLRSSLSLHIGSPPPCSAADLDVHIESLPSFVLTLPTPASPHSPIFSPGVPFTTERFLDAAEAAAPKDRAPTLPQCDHGQAGKLCRTCEMQLLACRVWFQNTDGGARAALHEPFVRPAQSTVRTRAVLASLGVGLGLGNACDEGDSARGDDGYIDDPGSLAIESPPVASSKLVPLDQAASWSKGVLSKLRVHLRKLHLPLPTTSLSNRSRKRRPT
ncbi:hypothetical protein BGY98DRAFT_1094972 [Russula aff. rugulosa BPL654]|nr:hypothetical protein BGY98DRAFT_1094972 [Russula aff. rugulosa BPL654]